MFGNFGVAILAVTVIVKAAFFSFANKSYESMAKMKKLQPEMEKLRERYKDDKMQQQKELMELYQKEKINPLAGCLPILIQIPVFFALYKVLFVSIDMRHAPFFGWIQDLSAPDPTSLFNLFGLLPYAVPDFLVVGVWPLLMGITMWLQMQLNPQQPDPDPAADLQLDAGDVHLPAGVVPGRARDLLGVEQRAVAGAAVVHHEAAGRRRAADGQPQTQLSAAIARQASSGESHRTPSRERVDAPCQTLCSAERNSSMPQWLFAQPWHFVRGVPTLEFLPEADRAEIAFAGRSNVGKSSLINALVNQHGLARTSNTPGRTQELNFFTTERCRRSISSTCPATALPRRRRTRSMLGRGAARLPARTRRRCGACSC